MCVCHTGPGIGASIIEVVIGIAQGAGPELEPPAPPAPPVLDDARRPRGWRGGARARHTSVRCMCISSLSLRAWGQLIREGRSSQRRARTRDTRTASRRLGVSAGLVAARGATRPLGRTVFPPVALPSAPTVQRSYVAQRPRLRPRARPHSPALADARARARSLTCKSFLRVNASPQSSHWNRRWAVSRPCRSAALTLVGAPRRAALFCAPPAPAELGPAALGPFGIGGRPNATCGGCWPGGTGPAPMGPGPGPGPPGG